MGKTYSSIKKYIAKNFRPVVVLRNNIRWFFQYKKLRLEHTDIKEFIPIAVDDKILIIAPHADDDLIGSYQLITEYKNNAELFYCGYTGFDTSQRNLDIRLAEFITFCEKKKVKYSIAGKDVKASLDEKLESLKPDYVFIPSLIDWHPEHIKISEMLLNSTAYGFNVVLYQVSVPIHNELLNCYVPMSKREHKRKWDDFYSVYKSQKSQPVRRYRYNERINQQADKDIYAAEVFSLLEYEYFKKMMNNFLEIKTNDKLEKLKLSRNDLFAVREAANEIFKLIKPQHI